MTIKLEEYNKKRNFNITAEPEGNAAEPEGQLRFVVQHHAASRDHYDLRLEWDGALLSWAVPKVPSYNTRDRRLAVQVEDHPLEYRNFEGTIPKGEYGGGVVMLWDEGYWEPQPQMNVEEGLISGSLKFILWGRRMKGKWALIRLKPKEGEKKNNWLLLKERDEYATDSVDLSEFNTSIRTGRTMAEIEEGEAEKTTKNPFQYTGVQLAKLTDSIPENADWLFEMKYDGYRILAYLEGNSVRLITRNGNDYTNRFRDVANSLLDWAGGRAMVLDGEMVITDPDGRTNFQALQSYMKNPRGQKLTYIAFDLLALDGEDLRGCSLLERKERLQELMKDAPGNLYYSQHVRGNGKQCFLAACQANMEGIVGKRADSLYSGTRNGDWIKLKCDKRQEFVIGGYTLTDKKTSGVSALLLGYYEGSDLIFAGRAGTGFSIHTMKELEEKFQQIIRADCPFKIEAGGILPKTLEAKANERITWLEPELVAEIKFAEWTDENLLRQASFKGLRTDKDPKTVRRETSGLSDFYKADSYENEVDEEQGGQEEDNSVQGETTTGVTEAGTMVSGTTAPGVAIPGAPIPGPATIGPEAFGAAMPGLTVPGAPAPGARSGAAMAGSLIIEGIKISNPDKVLYNDPMITKGDVVRYYAAVSERMLPFVANRVLSIVRCPKGVSQACFFKKHPGKDHKAIEIKPVINSRGEQEEYFYIKDVSGLIYEAQMGTLEFHTWGSRADDLERPDLMVFDLDPDEGMDLETIRQGVRDVKSILEELSLQSFLKTSGGKGYHIVVPFKPSADWDTFYDFAKKVAVVMEAKWPDRYTSNVRKQSRKGKIFIDWIRNGRGATSIAPYSLRARDGARVSMPIKWEELDHTDPDGIGMEAAILRVRSSEDPWGDFFKIDQKLK